MDGDTKVYTPLHMGGRRFQKLALIFFWGGVNFRAVEVPWRSGFVKGEGVKKCFYKLPSVSGQIQRKS